MSKKIIIGAVGVVAAGAAFVGFASYSSGVVEEKFKAAFEPAAAECLPSGFISKLDEYKRGTMTSTAITSHNLKKLQGLVPPLVIEHEIAHYPSLSGAARITSRIRVSEAVVKELGQEIPPIVTVVHSDGRYEGSWTAPDMNDRGVLNGAGKITINGVKFNFAQAETFKASLNLGKILADSPVAEGALSGLSYEIDMKDSPRCITHIDSKASIKLADLSFSEKRQGIKANYKNLNATASFTEKADDLAMKIVVGFDSVTGDGKESFAVKDMVFDATFDKLSKAGYLEMAKGLDTMPLMARPDQVTTAMMKFIPALVKNSPSFELTKLAFTVNMPQAQGSFLAQGKATFDANGFDGAKMNPALLKERIHMDGQAEVAKSLLAGIPGFVQSDMDGFMAQGFVTEEGNLYKTKASFDKGEFLINGKPFTPPGMAAARPKAAVDIAATEADDSEATPVVAAPAKKPAPRPVARSSSASPKQTAKPAIPNIFGRIH